MYVDSLHAHKHVPELTEAAQLLKKRLGMCMEKTSIDFEDLLALVSAISWVFILRRGVLMCGKRDQGQKLVQDTTKAFNGGRYTLVSTCVYPHSWLETV